MDATTARIIWKLLPKKFEPPEVGITPHSVVAEFGRSRLLKYAPTSESQFPVPVLFVPSLVNRHYILDLLPDRSVVAYLLKKGYTVYMLDWGEPGLEDAHTSLDDYIMGRLHHAVRTVTRMHDSPASLVGYCMGGSMALAYAAAMPEKVKNLVLLATPVDFSQCGLLTLWSKKELLPLQSIVDSHGLVPDWLLQMAFTMLKPEWVGRQNMALMQGADNPDFMRFYLAMSRWVNDNVPVAGSTLKEWTEEYFQKNGFMTGSLRCGGKPVTSASVTASIFNVIAGKDHIIPPASSLALDKWIGPGHDAYSHVFDLGHIGLSVGQGAFSQVWSSVAAWLQPRSGVKA